MDFPTEMRMLTRRYDATGESLAAIYSRDLNRGISRSHASCKSAERLGISVNQLQKFNLN